MERCDRCKCSPCRCSSKCSHILPPLAVLAIAIVILLGNLGIINSLYDQHIMAHLLGLAALLKMLCCAKDAKECKTMDKHCPSLQM